MHYRRAHNRHDGDPLPARKTHRVIGKDLRASIVKLYMEGASACEVARTFDVSPATVSNSVRKMGGTIRKTFLTREQAASIGALYEQGFTSGQLAKRFAVTDATILNHLRAMEIERRSPADARRVYPLDEEAFDRPTTESAYWTGFLMADGCVHDTGRVTLTLAARDKAHVERFAAFLGTPRPISERVVECAVNGRTGMYARAGLTVNSRRLSDALIARGVTARKTLTARASEEMQDSPSFWLGVLDGDGCIGASKTGLPTLRLACAARDLMEQYASFVLRVSGHSPNLLTRMGLPLQKHPLYRVDLTGKAVASVTQAVLAEGQLPLERKRERYLAATAYRDRRLKKPSPD